MESVSGNISLLCTVDQPGSQCPKTSQRAPQLGWEVKVFCRSAAAWTPQPPTSERTIKFQPLRSTPSPSVKMEKKFREQGQKRGLGENIGSHSDSFPQDQFSFLGLEDKMKKRTVCEEDGGRRPSPWAVGRTQEEGRCQTTVQLKNVRSKTNLNFMFSRSSSEPTFHVWPFQWKTPWETKFHTQPKRL